MGVDKLWGWRVVILMASHGWCLVLKFGCFGMYSLSSSSTSLHVATNSSKSASTLGPIRDISETLQYL